MNLSKTFLLAFLGLTLILFATCRKPAGGSSGTAAPGNASGVLEEHAPEGGAATSAQTKFFKGSIGTTLDLQMKLVKTADQLNGSYFYQKVGKKIDVRGTVDQAGNVTLQEFDTGGKQTGLFTGVWKVDPAEDLISISGNWSKPPGDKGADKKIAFSLHELPITLTGDAEVVSKQIKEENKKLNYTIDVQYPQINGGSGPNFDKFNQAARAIATKKVSDFKKDMESGDNEPPTPTSVGSDLSMSYEVALARDDLISVSFLVGSYSQGAAHPNYFSEVLNYDLKNGKQLSLKDVFKPGSKFIAAISAYSIADLKKQNKAQGANGMLDDATIENGAGPSDDNFGSWTIKKTGLGFIFDPYQVGPYAAGSQNVTVPYSTLKDLINPAGPLAQFVK